MENLLPKPTWAENIPELNTKETKQVVLLTRKNIQGENHNDDQMIFIGDNNLSQELLKTKIGGFARNVEKIDQIKHELLHPIAWEMCKKLFGDSKKINVLDARVELLLSGIQYCLDYEKYMNPAVQCPVLVSNRNSLDLYTSYVSFIIAADIINSSKQNFENINSKTNQDIQKFDGTESGDIRFEYNMEGIFGNVDISKEKAVAALQRFVDICKEGVYEIYMEYNTKKNFRIPAIMGMFTFTNEISFENQVKLFAEADANELFSVIEDLNVSDELIVKYLEYKNKTVK